MACGNPECEYAANPDPTVSDGFCCEKCEGRFNGEEWAQGGKKKHTAYCTSKMEDFEDFAGGCMPCAPAWAGGFGAKGGGKGKGGGGSSNKCANPECEFLKNSDASCAGESGSYCCEKCEGRHQGADWAEGGKQHYKHCEKIEAPSGGGGGWGGGGGGCCGCAGKKGWGKVDPWAAAEAWGPYGMMKGDCWGGKGKDKDKGKGKGKMKDGGGKGGKEGGGGCKGGGKSKGPGLKDFPTENKVWVGNLPEGAALEDVKEHFSLTGGTVEFAAIMKGNTGGVAYSSAEEAQTAITVLNLSDMGGQAIQVDCWTGPTGSSALS